MSARTVSPSELYDIWMRPEAIGLLVDEQRMVRVVTMDNGDTYEAPWGEQS